MKKINFQKFSMPDGIANKKQVTGDVRESVDASAVDEKEVEMMKVAATNFCQPRFMDALEMALADDIEGAKAE